MIRYLSGLQNWFGPLRVFDSITFRAVVGLAAGFALSILFGRIFIRWMRGRRVTEDVSKPDSETLHRLHAGKDGTPTMGGAMIVLAMAAGGLLCCDPLEPLILIGGGVVFAFALLGFADDYMKFLGLGKQGLTKRQKLGVQVLLAAAAAWAVGAWVPEVSTRLLVPFTKWATVHPDLGWVFPVFFAFVVTGCSNAVNLTDGLDGLASGCTVMVAVTYAILAYVVGNAVVAEYFRIPYIPGSGELTVFCSVMVGAVMGFLWFNAHPAEVFMGDTGSLALGAGLAYVALVIKHELVLVLAGGIFVLEAASVLIQMISFRWTGRRVFKCAPFHHHLEFCGWHENKVVVRLWMIGAVLAGLSLATLKMH